MRQKKVLAIGLMVIVSMVLLLGVIPTQAQPTTTGWVRLLGNADDQEGYGIVTDSQDNVYVTGGIYGDLDGNTSAGDYDIFVGKYDSGGTKQWTRLLGSAGYEEAYDIAVDSRDNVYVTGQTEGDLDGNTNAGGYDMFVAKYDSGGTKQWTRLLGSAYTDCGYGIAVDSEDNLYITGYTRGDLDGNTGAGLNDIFVAKYDSGGTRQWTRLLGSAASDYGYGIAVDSQDNVYITGYTEGNLDGNTNPGGSAIFVSKYDSGGARQWTRLLGSATGERAYAIAVDSQDNVYVTGWTWGNLGSNANAGPFDIFVAKYDSGGNVHWIRLLGTATLEAGYGIAVDSWDNVYVTGDTEGNLDGNVNAGDDDVFVVKYDSGGNRQWTCLLGTATSESGEGIAVDSWGSVYVVGETYGNLGGNANAGIDDVFVCKLLGPPVVLGTVNLQGRADNAGATVTVGDASATTGSDGTYILQVEPGTYTINISMPGYLAAHMTDVLLSSGDTLTVDATLLAGDVNGDGIVDIFDLTLVGMNYQKTESPIS